MEEIEQAKEELYQEVKKLVVREQKASASFLQRNFRLSYIRAYRFLERLEEDGIIGRDSGAKPRKVIKKK